VPVPLVGLMGIPGPYCTCGRPQALPTTRHRC
jgi:hypothetical protein